MSQKQDKIFEAFDILKGRIKDQVLELLKFVDIPEFPIGIEDNLRLLSEGGYTFVLEPDQFSLYKMVDGKRVDIISEVDLADYNEDSYYESTELAFAESAARIIAHEIDKQIIAMNKNLIEIDEFMYHNLPYSSKEDFLSDYALSVAIRIMEDKEMTRKINIINSIIEKKKAESTVSEAS